MDNLTPSLNEQQIRENIDALQQAGTPNEKIQSYVDNYQRATDGTYILKQQQTPIETQVPSSKFGFTDAVRGAVSPLSLLTNPTILQQARQTSLSALGQMINQFNEGTQQLASGIDAARSAPDIRPEDIQAATLGGGRLAGFAEAGAQVAKGATHALANVGTAVGGAFTAATAPLAPLFQAGTAVGQAIGNAIPSNIAMKGEDFLRANPSVGQNASDILGLSNLALPEAVGKTAPLVGTAGSKIGEAVKNTGTTIGERTSQFAQKAKSPIGSFTSLEGDVGNALGFTGKMGASQALGKTSQSIRALGHIVENAPNIKVTDANGIEVPFNPSKATFPETLDAWKQTRDSIYNQYTAEAAKAGDKGAVFNANDFNSLLSTLDSAGKNSTSAFKSKANSLKQDIIDNFGFTDKKTGNVIFYDTSLKNLQGFLEKVNVDVNPLSDKAGAQISLELSQKIRQIMDSKIENATGAKYQALRNKYADMKSIESDLVNQFKKAARGQGGTIAKYVEGFGSLDTLLAVLRGSPIEALGGLGTFSIGKIMEMLKDPTRALQRSFEKLQNQRNVPSIQDKTNLANKTPIATSKTKIISPILSNKTNNVKSPKRKK